jgi:NADPH:quinone reductase-like Zn-dependent oxidoreductase
MTAMGVFGDIDDLGIEGSGVVHRVGAQVENFRVGDRVIIGGYGLMRTKKIVDSEHCMKIPDELSLEDAASMPVVFGTVIYSLVEVGALRKGQV